jgi:hypothetical protein
MSLELFIYNIPNDIKLKIYYDYIDIKLNFDTMIFLFNNNKYNDMKKYITRLLNDEYFFNYTINNSNEFKLILTDKFINIIKKINYNIFLVTLFYSKYKFIQFKNK